MHAIAQSSPVTDLQTRLDLEKEQEDVHEGVSHTAVGDLCERCHAPTGTAASPSISSTPEPSESPQPSEQETPVRVCMEQTGQTRLQCLAEIRRSNGR